MIETRRCQAPPIRAERNGQNAVAMPFENPRPPSGIGKAQEHNLAVAVAERDRLSVRTDRGREKGVEVAAHLAKAAMLPAVSVIPQKHFGMTARDDMLAVATDCHA